MKNNTRIRLHLSKQLFESLATQVLAESKKDAMSGGAYTEAVKAPKAKGEKAAGSTTGKSKPATPKAEKPAAHKAEKPAAPKSPKPMKKEGMGGQEKKVKITLDEYTGSGWEYELGKWVADNWPSVAKALESESGDAGQKLVDLGGQIVVLATTGSAMLGAGLAIAIDDIKAAAKKIKARLTGGKVAVAEGSADSELDAILAKVPEEKKNVQ